MSIHLSQPTVVSTEELQAAQGFHGHRCPAMPQGLRAGHLAMDILGVSRARGGRELIAVVETGRHHFSGCFVDGVQFATGCTAGKGNLEQEPMGKFAVTLVDPATHRAVRVALKSERLLGCLSTEFFRLRAQGVPPWDVEPGLVDPLITEVLTRPWQELFEVRLFPSYPYDLPQEAFTAVRCADCGEVVVERYATAFEGSWLCRPCLDARLHGGNRQPGA